MKILFIVTYLYSRGGDSNHAFSVAEGLREEGHKVDFFGMEDKRNIPDLPGPLAPNIDYRTLINSGSPLRFLKTLRSIYSHSSKKALKEFIGKHGPFDLAHVHSVHHQLTMSVLDVLKAKRIPFVWTLHDYKLICPNTTLFNETTGKRCENPGKGSPLCVIRRRCKKSSFLASILTGIESGFNYLGGYYNYPECYISPSEFLKDLIISRKVTDRPVRVIPNFSPLKPEKKPESLSSDFLFIGRLSRVKGVDILIRAFADSYPQITGKLVIVGSGEAEKELKDLASELIPEDRYIFVGQLDSSEEITQCYRNARCMILPSIWYENMPLSILESFAHARTVIASNIGGIPEMVIDGKTGLLCEPGSVSDLSEKLLYYSSNIEKARLDGLNGWKYIKDNLPRVKYINKIIRIYAEVMSGSYRE